MDSLELIGLAEKARQNSYTPYSHFRVGAALLTKSGKVYIGCNIENSSYPAGICAERTAIFKAVSEGETEFEKIAIIGAKEGEKGRFCAPCGICRQVMAEFVDDKFLVVLGSVDKVEEFTLNELLPFAFTPKDLQ